MVTSVGGELEDAPLVPRKLNERLEKLRALIRSLNQEDFSKNISIPTRYDSFVPIEKDMNELVEKMKEMNEKSEKAMAKIKEALGEIIKLTKTVKQATENIKEGTFDTTLDAESSLTEVKELKKSFQYLFSVVQLLSTDALEDSSEGS